MRKPWYQKFITIYLPTLVGAFFLIGSILDTFSNSREWITPNITYFGTGLIVLLFIIANLTLRKKPLVWSTNDNQMIRIKSLGIVPMFALCGIIIALWLPRFFNSSNDATILTLSNTDVCKRDFEKDGDMLVSFPEFDTFTEAGLLRINAKRNDFFQGIDLGCTTNIYSITQTNVRLDSGSQENGFCIAFGGVSIEEGILNKYYAFCIDGLQTWRVIDLDQGNLREIDSGISDHINPGYEANLLEVQNSNGEIELKVNAERLYHSSIIRLYSNKIGLAFGIAKLGEPSTWSVTDVTVLNSAEPIAASASFPGFSSIAMSSGEEANTINASGTPNTLEAESQIIFTQSQQIEEPIATYVLVDQSNSMMMNDPNKITFTTVDLISTIVPPNDWLGVAAFGQEIEELAPIAPVGFFQFQNQPLLAETTNLGNTDFPQALLFGLDRLKLLPYPNIRQIILITDGQSGAENFSEMSNDFERLEEALKLLAENSISLHVIDIQSPRNYWEIEADFWQEMVARDLANYTIITSSDQLPGIVLETLYASHTGKTATNKFVAESPGSWSFTIPPGIEHLQLIVSTKETNIDDPFQIRVEGPTSENYSLAHIGSNLISVALKNPLPGEWKIISSSLNPTLLEIHSLALVSRNP